MSDDGRYEVLFPNSKEFSYSMDRPWGQSSGCLLATENPSRRKTGRRTPTIVTTVTSAASNQCLGRYGKLTFGIIMSSGIHHTTHNSDITQHFIIRSIGAFFPMI